MTLQKVLDIYVLTCFSDPEYGSILKFVTLIFITVLYELHNIYYVSLCDRCMHRMVKYSMQTDIIQHAHLQHKT